MLVRWAVTADKETSEKIQKLSELPPENRHSNPLLVDIVDSLYHKWNNGKSIEKLATFDWNKLEVCKLLDSLLYQLPSLQKSYMENVKIHGIPPELNDSDLEKYEKSISEESKKNFK